MMCGEGHAENVANMCMEVRSRASSTRARRVIARVCAFAYDSQVSRVLRPNGIFMIISYRDDYFEVRAAHSRTRA